MSDNVIRIPPYTYIWVLDNNSNVTRVECGPQTFIRQEHEKITCNITHMVSIPPRHYCAIENPVVRDDDKNPVFDRHGQPKLRYGDTEYRLHDDWQDPFPLYPGESMSGSIARLRIVANDTALRIRALRNFTSEGAPRHAGDEWLFRGPDTYIPRAEETIEETVTSVIIKPNQALKLRARKECQDSDNQPRSAGEEWLIRRPGAFLPDVDEEIIEVVDAIILTNKRALHLRATRTFTDVYGKKRKAGEEWLVTSQMEESHIPDVYERVVNDNVAVTTLDNRQYCIVLDPFRDGKNQLGVKEQRKGECSFFLQPGERLENGIQDIIILEEDEGLLLRAREGFEDTCEEKMVERQAGDKWMVYGPLDFIPPIQVEILEQRKAIPLDENEGIYVRDIKTGRVRAVIGETCMLKPHEELWEKELPELVERLLIKQAMGQTYLGDSEWEDSTAYTRDRTLVVTFRVPHNAAVQVYDYQSKTSRVVFGPELVMLGPDEQFTVISLSGSKPKKPNVIKSLSLQMGPDFMTDIVTVETSDHARLQLQLSYNWYFRINRDDPDDASKMFSVRDFVGDCCKAIASRVRGAVASEPFDNFHRNSAKIIRASVFGRNSEGKINEELMFSANNLIITNVDIQAVEPVDTRTRDSLQKSVQLAIEITTKSQEAKATHEAMKIEEMAKGELEQQAIENQSKAEEARKRLLQLRAESSAVESQGRATAEARARAESQQIEGQSAVEQAKLRAEAMRIESEAKLEQSRKEQEAEIEHTKEVNNLDIERARKLAEIESKKFADIVRSIGPDTIATIAQAGPEMQVKMLQALGLKGFLVTDGTNPINLFNTASGLVGGGMGGQMGHVPNDDDSVL